MPSASDNGGVYPYPLVQDLSYPNSRAPERAGGEYTGELDDSGPRVKGYQPGFDIPGIPLSSIQAED